MNERMLRNLIQTVSSSRSLGFVYTVCDEMRHAVESAVCRISLRTVRQNPANDWMKRPVYLSVYRGTDGRSVLKNVTLAEHMDG